MESPHLGVLHPDMTRISFNIKKNWNRTTVGKKILESLCNFHFFNKYLHKSKYASESAVKHGSSKESCQWKL